MKISEVMTRNVEYIPSSTTLEEAAVRMRELDTGFLPIGDSPDGRLQGVITDRDIVVRALAEGLDPADTTVEQVRSDRVLYCFQDDDLHSAADSMGQQQVYRLVVLDNPDDKRLSGVITLGDILRHDQEHLAERTARNIVDDDAA